MHPQRTPALNHLLDLFLDRLGLIRRAEFDERIAELAIALGCLAADVTDLMARLDEFDLTRAPGAELPPRKTA